MDGAVDSRSAFEGEVLTGMSQRLEDLARSVLTRPCGARRLVSLAGAPASGKSTMADGLAAALGRAGATAQVVPMDGFHLDNRLLIARGLLARKGAPETFDASGFVHLMRRLKEEQEVVYPVFDRARDIAIAAGGRVAAECDVVIVEGNYLLFDANPWRGLAPLWDTSIRIAPPIEVLRERLVARWIEHGLSVPDAVARAEGNDLANAKLIADKALPADINL